MTFIFSKDSIVIGTGCGGECGCWVMLFRMGLTSRKFYLYPFSRDKKDLTNPWHGLRNKQKA